LLLIDQDCYEPVTEPSDRDDWSLVDTIPRPLPLGRMARRLEEIAAAGVVTRSIDFYAALASANSARPGNGSTG